MERGQKLVVLSLVGALLAVTVVATMEEDEKDCADQLTNLASCIPFVSGDAKKPTPECCEDTKKVRAAKPKCLCVLIKESTDSSMGLPVNTTLALQMPAACNIDAKVSDCPSLLKLPPNSPDAKIFKEADAGSSTSSATGSPPASASTSTSSPGSSKSSSSSPETGSSSNSKASTSGNGGVKLSGRLLLLMSLASTALMLI
ncbi:unnamed protein product [Ilex paraguariensis]|uniref:Bifunctional inhibitor/plant lipid transfer protein/seed storage helical domain-containing protein n=1 Tax=Ilex paraguariensis TaxID=185542 RepID=A0ABC8TS78_9AQUA